MQNVVDDYVRTTPEDADRCAIRLRTVGKCLANKKNVKRLRNDLLLSTQVATSAQERHNERTDRLTVREQPTVV